MRERPAGRMLRLTGWMLTGLFVAGCQSTPSLPKGLARAMETLPPSGDVAWKKAPGAPSAASAQEQWTAAPKPTETVRRTVFQEPAPKTDWMPPIPQIMIKDDPTAPVVVQGSPLKHVGKHHKAPLPIPNAPNEGTPVALPAYVVRPADVLTVELLPQFTRDKKDQSIKSDKIGLNQPIYGPHPVHPDGTISLGIYGPVLVAGKTVLESREEIARAIHKRLNPETVDYKDVFNNLKVDIANYNNGFYYVITNMAGQWQMGELVERLPVTGTETVLDAVSKIQTKGLPGSVSPTRIWVARSNAGHGGPDNILPVDWKAITQQGVMNTNWQIMPGDRVYLEAFPVRVFDNALARVLAPVQRLLSVGQSIQSIRNTNGNTNLVAPPLP